MSPTDLITQASAVLPLRLSQWAGPVAAAAIVRRLSPLYILAILDRESNGRSADIKGYDGYGRGLMQIDARYHSSFCEAYFLGKPLWSDAATNVLMGATLLRELVDTFKGNLWSAAAAYNCGPAKVMKALAKLPPGASEEDIMKAADSGTTGQNYGVDVRRRMERFIAAFAAFNRKGGNV